MATYRSRHLVDYRLRDRLIDAALGLLGGIAAGIWLWLLTLWVMAH